VNGCCAGAFGGCHRRASKDAERGEEGPHESHH
jgi:hypothetical protein